MAERQRRAFERTLKICETLAKRAEAALVSKKAASEGWALPREERAALADLVKLLGLVLEFDKKYFRSEPAAGGGGGGAGVDLDAAREEVARRLDRLAAAG